MPVEADGSAYFEAPPGKELIFQLLDANGMAVHSMRSVAFVHPGEMLSCAGCHEPTHAAPRRPRGRVPMALRREPSVIAPEANRLEPVTYYRLVRPVFERTCIPCHRRRPNAGPKDMSYNALRPYAFFFSGGFLGSVVTPVHGGSRTIPGRFGALNSRMGRALLNKTHRGKVSQADFRRVVLWLDSNAPRLGACHSEADQVAGKLVWPKLDVDPNDPLGLGRPSRRQVAPDARRH